MIISNLQTPEKSLYVIGARLIKSIESNQSSAMEPLELYEIYNKKNSSISFSYFHYGLVWLFITGAIELTNSGNVKLCS